MNPASNHSRWGAAYTLWARVGPLPVLVPLGSCEQMGLGHGPFCQPGGTGLTGELRAFLLNFQ